jgi:hypothetical protein
MQAESLEVLEKADIVPAQARAIVRAIEIEIAGAKDSLATKHDLLLLGQQFHAEIERLRREVVEFAAEFRADASVLRSEMAQLKAELKADITAKIEIGVSGVVRQLYLAILGQMAVLLGFSYFFATHIR